MSVRRGKRIEPRSRDWMTGEGFTNGLSTPDLSYLDSVVMNALSGGYAAGLQAAREAVAARLIQMGYDTDDTNPYLAAIDALRGDSN